MADLPKTCSHCGGESLFKKKVQSGGLYGPHLLPGLGSFFSPGEMYVVLCSDCGHMLFFADKHARKKVTQSTRWKRM